MELATLAETNDRVPGGRIAEILERSERFFSHVLWETETGAGVRTRLAEAGVEEPTLRRFGVGYAPVGHRDLLEHLRQWDFSPADLREAGIATGSGSRHLHAQFRSRVMFSIKDPAGPILGFAGLATHLGPSWPLWLTSPDRGPFRKGAAIFAIDRAAAAIAAAGRALVLDDCLEVLRRHQSGEENAVAVIGSPVTPEHLEQIAAALSLDPGELGLARRREGRRDSASTLLVGPLAELGEGAVRPRESGTTGDGGGVAGVGPATEPRPRRGRALQALASGGLGLGVPLGWLLYISPSEGDPGGASSSFVNVGLAVAGTYMLLGIVAALLSARTAARSSQRRMRAPWEHGSGEWQPTAWTYHRLEEVLIAAAAISIVVCMAMFLTIGGFGG